MNSIQPNFFLGKIDQDNHKRLTKSSLNKQQFSSYKKFQIGVPQDFINRPLFFQNLFINDLNFFFFFAENNFFRKQF